MGRASREAPERRRAEIMAAARACFGERGYHETRIDEIAQRAGVSKGAIYWYFDGKRELFLELLDRYIEERGPRQLDAAVAESALEGLRATLDSLLAGLGETLPGFELILEYMAHAGRDPELRRRFRALDEAARAVLAPVLERGVQSGELRPTSVDDAARLCAALLDGLMMQKVIRPEIDLGRLWGEAQEMLIRALRADADDEERDPERMR